MWNNSEVYLPRNPDKLSKAIKSFIIGNILNVLIKLWEMTLSDQYKSLISSKISCRRNAFYFLVSIISASD